MSRKATPRGDFGQRLFRVLLLLYPPPFRARFGGEMVEFFNARRQEVGARYDARGSFRFWRHLLADVVLNAPLQWLSISASSEPAAEPDVPWASPFYLQREDSMDSLKQDIRFALRTLRARPTFTAVAILTLALGIGATTTIFSVVDAVLVRPLPWPAADRLAVVWGTRGSARQNGVVYQDFLDWRKQSRSFASLGVMRGQSVNLTGGEQPERVIGEFVTASVFRMLGNTAEQGRLFTDAETEVATKQPVAVITDGFWRTRFAARANAIGSTLILNGQPFTIVGVAKADASEPLGAPDVWMPIGYYPNQGDLDHRGQPGVLVLAEIRPGVSLASAQADLDAICHRLATDYPQTNAGVGAYVEPVGDVVVGPVRTPMLIVFASVGIVLLIACANVANLQLARAAARRRELSVRTALGARRSRLVRQLLTESLVLSVAGGILGVLLARWGVAALSDQLLAGVSVHGAIVLDAPVLLFALAVTVGAGLLFGSAPAWQYSRADANDALTVRGDNGSSNGRASLRNALVVGQIALCVVMLVSAGLLTRSLFALARVSPGFDPSHTLTLQFRLPVTKYKTDGQIADMFTRTLSELRAVPGVERAALVRATPLNGNGETYPYAIADKPTADPQHEPTAQLNVVSPGYFETLRIPRLAGRDFTMQDRDGVERVAIVNDRLAKHNWPNESALGKRIRIGGPGTPWATIVGVVGTVKQFQLSELPLEQAYVSYLQRPLIFTEAVVRTRGDAGAIANAIRAAIWRVDPDQPVWRVRTMDSVLDAARGGPRLTVWLMAAAAILSLVLAAVGVYGVTSYTVARRTHEVGIRIALGAGRRHVLALVLRQGMELIALALVIGLVGAATTSRLLASQLFGVNTTDPLTFVAVPLVLASVALVACYLPARRASRVDPITALRAD
jgi:putative ABC transport system permease protein